MHATITSTLRPRSRFLPPSCRFLHQNAKSQPAHRQHPIVQFLLTPQGASSGQSGTTAVTLAVLSHQLLMPRHCRML